MRPDTIRAARDVKKDQILETAAELIMASGFAEMSVRDLAKAVDMSQASLYYYIGSKSQLLDEIANSFVDETIVRLTQVATSQRNPAEQLEDFIAAMLQLVEEILGPRMAELPGGEIRGHHA